MSAPAETILPENQSSIAPAQPVELDDTAVLECLEVCAANGWLPGKADVLRLRLVRWLVQQNRITDDVAESGAA